MYENARRFVVALLILAAALLSAPRRAALADDITTASDRNNASATATSTATRATQIYQGRYDGRPAIQITDGVTEAVVVPELGRLMRYGYVGGFNWLWNAGATPPKYGDWVNWGGDKTWPAPEHRWREMGSPGAWPPPAAWDSTPHWFKVIQDPQFGPTLRTVSRVSAGTGARLIRDYRLQNGELVVVQAAEKVSGPPIEFGLWCVAQIGFTEAVYVPLNENSPFKNNWVWLGKAPMPQAKFRNISPTLMEIRPAHYVPGVGPKMGADSTVSALVAVHNGIALRLRSARPSGEYPDRTPVQVYVSGDPTSDYVELELHSPLRRWIIGSRWQHTIRWSLTQLQNKSVDDPALHAEVEALLLAR